MSRRMRIRGVCIRGRFPSPSSLRGRGVRACLSLGLGSATATSVAAPALRTLSSARGAATLALRAAVAQLARASACHAEGRGFESLQPLLVKAPLRRGFRLFGPHRRPWRSDDPGRGRVRPGDDQGHPQWRADRRAGILSYMNTTASRPSRLPRSTADKKIAGVSGGLAAYFDVDPLLVRIGFVVASLLSGAGLLAYLLMMAFVPTDDAAPAG